MIINGKDITIQPGANLCDVDLHGADLYSADLSDANLSYANLRGADLRYANLRCADLSGANLRDADLHGSSLSCANLRDALMPPLRTPEGDLVGYKKVADGTVLKLRIPSEAKRTASWAGNKLRAEYAIVLEGEGTSTHDNAFVYKQWELVRPDSYNDDPRVECANGIHFFLTRQEAEDY